MRLTNFKYKGAVAAVCVSLLFGGYAPLLALAGEPPQLEPIGAKFVNEENMLVFTVNASDPENDALVYSATGLPAGANFDPSTRVFSWMPSESDDSVTPYVVSFEVSDGESTHSENVEITVGEVNEAPRASNVWVAMHMNQSLTITLPASDSDVPSQLPLTFEIVSAPANGTLGAVVGDNVTYTPTLDWNGADSFTFRANDGVAESNIRAINITVNDSAPILNSIADQTVTEHMTLTLAGNVIVGNDPDDDPLTFSLVDAPVGATIDALTGNFSWTPTENDGPGTFLVTVAVTEGGITDSKTFNINVEEANDAPVTENGSATTTVNTAVEITFAAADGDVPAQTLQFSIVTSPQNGTLGDITDNKVTYTPNTDWEGEESFTFKATDGVTDSNVSSISITVSPAINAPAEIVVPSVDVPAVVVPPTEVIGGGGGGGSSAAIFIFGIAEGNAIAPTPVPTPEPVMIVTTPEPAPEVTAPVDSELVIAEVDESPRFVLAQSFVDDDFVDGAYLENAGSLEIQSETETLPATDTLFVDESKQSTAGAILGVDDETGLPWTLILLVTLLLLLPAWLFFRKG